MIDLGLRIKKRGAEPHPSIGIIVGIILLLDELLAVAGDDDALV